jgi:hypothetical protein
MRAQEMIMPVEATVKQDCNAITPKSFTDLALAIREMKPQWRETPCTPAKYAQL